jgi:tetratricopeptide (TPR) repeat protein
MKSDAAPLPPFSKGAGAKTMRFIFCLFLLPAVLFPQNNLDRKALLDSARQERRGEKALALFQRVALPGLKDEYAEEANYRMGQYYYAKGEYAAAARVFDSLVLGFPAGYFKSEAMFWKALSFLSSGNKDSALALLGRLTEEDPAVYVRGRIVLGVLLARDGKYAESNQSLEKALKLGDNALRSTAYYQLSRNFRALSDTGQAAVYAKKLKEEFPNALETPQAEIDLKTLLKGSEKPVSVSAVPVAVPPRESFTLQLGAFQNRENAEKLRRKYADTYGNTEVMENKRENTTLYVVRLGSFKNPKDAEEFATLELSLTAKDFKVVKK